MRLLTAAFLALCALPSLAAELEIPEGGYVVSDDVSLLPQAVRDKRAALLKTAESGDMGALAAIVAEQPSPPIVSFGEPEDPIAYLKQQSGDAEGVAILAILANLLSAPFAAMDGGDGQPMYVWPYFAAMEDLRVLEPEQLVDAYRILGYAGFEEQRQVGGWIWWRVYIDEDGSLSAFVAGD